MSLITFECKNCGLITKDKLYLVETDEECIICCKDCNCEAPPSPGIINDDESLNKLEDIITELAEDLHKEEFFKNLQSLLAKGLIAIAGIGEDGEEYYELTDDGRAIKEVKDAI
jgi:hypothetical protein